MWPKGKNHDSYIPPNKLNTSVREEKMPYILPVNKHLIKKEIFSLLVNEKEFSPIIMKYGKFLQSMKYKLKTAFGKIGKHFRHRFIAKLFYTYSFV